MTVPGVTLHGCSRVASRLLGGAPRSHSEIPGTDVWSHRRGRCWCSAVSGCPDTLGIPIVKGRGFSTIDMEQAHRVAVINETLARRILRIRGSAR